MIIRQNLAPINLKKMGSELYYFGSVRPDARLVLAIAA